MTGLSPSIKIYVGLILILAGLSALSVFLPAFQGLLPAEELPASRPVLALVNAAIALVISGGLSFLGLKFSQKVGFASLWDPQISNRQRFLIPAFIGAGIGVFFIAADVIFTRFHALGPLPHPPFPVSIVASLTAGIGEELLFRLFFISFWVWLISHVILRRRWQNQVFWLVAIALLLIPSTRRREGTLAIATVLVFISMWIDKGLGLLMPGFIPSPTGELLEYFPTVPEALITLVTSIRSTCSQMAVRFSGSESIKKPGLTPVLNTVFP